MREVQIKDGGFSRKGEVDESSKRENDGGWLEMHENEDAKDAGR